MVWWVDLGRWEVVFVCVCIGFGLGICGRGGIFFLRKYECVTPPPPPLHTPPTHTIHLQVRNAIIWGNHSSTQVPSAAQAEVNFSADLDPRKWRPLGEALPRDSEAWLHGVRF